MNGVIQGMPVTGENLGAGATVTSVNVNTRVVTLSATNTGTVNGNIIFGEETSINWVNIDIQRTKVVNLSCLVLVVHLALDYTFMVTLQHLLQQLGSSFTVGARQDGTGVMLFQIN